jgi:mannose-6-phosphate isomerase-like protein (cupin superfamily)
MKCNSIPLKYTEDVYLYVPKEAEMIKLIPAPKTIQAAGNMPKAIHEFFGMVNSQTPEISIARMQSPAGWEEPGQTPEFDEYTVVLRGMLRVETKKDDFYVHENQAIMIGKGEWVRYSSPGEEGCEYLAICLPAFSSETVHRDPENQKHD